MNNTEVNKRIMNWLVNNLDEDTNEEALFQMKNGSEETLLDAFTKELAFGTGGLRGIIGPGLNRMNVFTVGRLVQALINYLKTMYPHENLKIAVAFDTRKNSAKFASHTARIIESNGHHAWLFTASVPLGLLSFFIREHHCHAGIMITASHNPKEYNGIKVFWRDGSQISEPHDNAIKELMMAITTKEQIILTPPSFRTTLVGSEAEDSFLAAIGELPWIYNHASSDLSVTYSALHGAGFYIVPKALKHFGFFNVHEVEAQMLPDPSFTTVHLPNPEDPEAMTAVLQLAKEKEADIALATDPDCDRVGVAYRERDGNYKLLNGNEIATLLFDFVLRQLQIKGLLTPQHFCISTNVTTPILPRIAFHYGVRFYATYTGFKNIAIAINEHLEQREHFAIAAEESYGYLVSDFIRDKDAVSAIITLGMMATEQKKFNKTLGEYLDEIYSRHGVFSSVTYSISLSNMSCLETAVSKLRRQKIDSIGGAKMRSITDYRTGVILGLQSGEERKIDPTPANMLCYELEDSLKIIVRPSGTEPKVKFYIHLQQAYDGSMLVPEIKEQLKVKQEELAKAFEMLLRE